MSEYSTGTVSVTNASTTVVGVGTLFSANVTAGDLFTIVASGIVYEVSSVTDDTHLELTGAYAGTTATGQSYAISTSFTSPDSIPYPEQGDTEPTTILKRSIATIQGLFTKLAPTFVAGDARKQYQVNSGETAVELVHQGAANNVTINFASDADLTLSAAQNAYSVYTITDTGVVLTTGRNVVVSTDERFITVTNSTAQTLTVKTSAGTGIAVPASVIMTVYCDGTDVVVSDFDPTNLTVPADSNGNVSRWVMDTAAGSAADSGYWSKICTVQENTASVYGSMTLVLDIVDTDSALGEATTLSTVGIEFRDTVASGLSSTLTVAQVIHISGTALSKDSFMIVGSSTEGQPIDIYMRKDVNYHKFAIYERAKTVKSGSWTVNYYDGAAWSATTPSGTVTVTSDWAGTFTWSPTFVNGTFTYSQQVGFIRKTGGLIFITGRVDWSSVSGTGQIVIQLPNTNNSGAYSTAGLGYTNGVDNNTEHQLVGNCDPGTSLLKFWYLNDNAGPTGTQVANLSATGQIQFTVILAE